MDKPLKVLIAEDSAILRDGLLGLLNRRGCKAEGVSDGGALLARLDSRGFETMASAISSTDGSGKTAPSVEPVETTANATLPDVVVIDIRMPPTFTDEGLRAAKEIRAKYPKLPVLLFSQYVEAKYATDLLSGNTNGVGYLLKDRVADVGEFIEALHRVASGETVLDPEVVSQLVRSTTANSRLSRLTQREREVLELMAEGRSNTAIAEKLFLSAGAVEKNVAAIFTKLDLPPASADNRRVLAVRHYLGL